MGEISRFKGNRMKGSMEITKKYLYELTKKAISENNAFSDIYDDILNTMVEEAKKGEWRCCYTLRIDPDEFSLITLGELIDFLKAQDFSVIEGPADGLDYFYYRSLTISWR